MNLSLKRRRKWLCIIKALRKELPTPLPTAIRLTNRKEPGIAIFYEDHVSIRISKKQDYNGIVDSLAHEYAHALDCSSTGDDHGETWGVWYSRTYKVVEDALERFRKRYKPPLT